MQNPYPANEFGGAETFLESQTKIYEIQQNFPTRNTKTDFTKS